jgi:RNA polymerase sigma factor (sigma-70 family)
MGFSWELILKYQDMITYIARKYSGDPDLAEDVAQEVILKLYEDKKLDVAKFNPAKRDAAIRQTIRNKVIKVLRSRRTGRWTFESLDKFKHEGFQLDDHGNLIRNRQNMRLDQNPLGIEQDDRE